MTVYVSLVQYRYVEYDVAGVFSTIDLAIASGHEFAKVEGIINYSVTVSEATIDGGIASVRAIRSITVQRDDS